MSRLIRDTDLMQDLAECTMVAIDRSGTGLEWKDYIKLDDVVRVIKSQPTAYDVEAVVRELEEVFKRNYGKAVWKNQYLTQKVIEIVRGGRLIDEQKLIEELNKEIAWIKNTCVDDEYHEGRIHGLECAVEFAFCEQPADQWIPCSEGLPDKKGIYWVTPNWKSDCVLVCEWMPECRWFEDEFGRIEALAWMPCDRPEAYRKNERKKND